MKLTIAVLLLAAACHAEVAGSTQKEDSRTERKAPEQSSVQKRAPAALPTASPSPTPGIEYADSKDSQTEKTPAQQIYLAPASPVAKFSDVLAGQGAAFPAAIAGHLYSPVSIYQPRLSSPTTYEISAPIPSQLAYSEHKIAYQPQQNAIQNAAQEYNQKLPNPKQAIARLTVNYQPYPQQLLVQPQPSLYNQQPQLLQQFPVYQPEALNQPIQPVQYQGPQIFGQNQQFHQQPLIQLVQAPPGITYARQEESNEEQAHQKPIQRELKTGQPEGVKELEKRIELQQNNAPLQGAVSYASFSQGPPAPAFTQPQYQQQPLQRYQPQPQYQSQQYLQPIQYQQPLYQQQQIQYQVPQYQIPQYQPAPQRQIISRPEANVVAASKQVQRPVTYFRQGPTIQQIQPQYQHQYQGQENNYQANLPPVQYFGKFAQSIFGQYQQQQQQQV